MKVYILLEKDFDVSNGNCIDVLNVYKTKKQAEKEKEKIIKDNIKNYGFVIDEQDKNRIFYKFYENWDIYIELEIIEKEVV